MLESPRQASTDELQRIHSALLEENFNSQLINNTYDEAVAVKVRAGFDLTHMHGVMAFWNLIETFDFKEHWRIRNVVPIQGRYIYPPAMLKLMDCVVQSATNNNLLATRLGGSADDMAVPKPKRLDSDLHLDLKGGDDKPSGEVLHAIVVHIVALGHTAVRFGAIRSERDRLDIANCGDTYRLGVVERLGAPFVTTTQDPGDILIFRGSVDQDRGLLPVAHEFVTTSEERMWHAFNPHVGSLGTVADQRRSVIEQYGLAELGYVA